MPLNNDVCSSLWLDKASVDAQHQCHLMTERRLGRGRAAHSTQADDRRAADASACSKMHQWKVITISLLCASSRPGRRQAAQRTLKCYLCRVETLLRTGKRIDRIRRASADQRGQERCSYIALSQSLQRKVVIGLRLLDFDNVAIGIRAVDRFQGSEIAWLVVEADTRCA